jgi:hypothetical protein
LAAQSIIFFATPNELPVAFDVYAGIFEGSGMFRLGKMSYTNEGSFPETIYVFAFGAGTSPESVVNVVHTFAFPVVPSVLMMKPIQFFVTLQLDMHVVGVALLMVPRISFPTATFEATTEKVCGPAPVIALRKLGQYHPEVGRVVFGLKYRYTAYMTANIA